MCRDDMPCEVKKKFFWGVEKSGKIENKLEIFSKKKWKFYSYLYQVNYGGLSVCLIRYMYV